MAVKTYSEKLKDPRWQKKRLEILNRDEFACQMCGDTEETLHVHHIKYADGDPWDIEDQFLVTLCETCHLAEPGAIVEVMKEFTSVCKEKGWTSHEMSGIVHIINFMKDRGISYPPTWTIMLYLVNDDELFKIAEDRYNKARQEKLKKEQGTEMPF